ncbi:unnamed protein product [Urochloa humidicola]
MEIQSAAADVVVGQIPAAPSAAHQTPYLGQRVPYLQLQGSPGTASSLALRFIQCLTAALALAAMVSANDFFTAPAFSFLVAANAIQTLWSLGLALVDIDILITGCTLTNALFRCMG